VAGLYWEKLKKKEFSYQREKIQHAGGSISEVKGGRLDATKKSGGEKGVSQKAKGRTSEGHISGKLKDNDKKRKQRLRGRYHRTAARWKSQQTMGRSQQGKTQMSSVKGVSRAVRGVTRGKHPWEGAAVRSEYSSRGRAGERGRGNSKEAAGGIDDGQIGKVWASTSSGAIRTRRKP